jgi:hypothetical protein
MNLLWLGLAYCVGSYAGYLIGRGKMEETIDITLESLMNNGFLRYKKDQDGNVEIMKWNENES